VHNAHSACCTSLLFHIIPQNPFSITADATNRPRSTRVTSRVLSRDTDTGRGTRREIGVMTASITHQRGFALREAFAVAFHDDDEDKVKIVDGKSTSGMFGRSPTIIPICLAMQPRFSRISQSNVSIIFQSGHRASPEAFRSRDKYSWEVATRREILPALYDERGTPEAE